jgi:hypothetical protein
MAETIMTMRGIKYNKRFSKSINKPNIFRKRDSAEAGLFLPL